MGTSRQKKPVARAAVQLFVRNIARNMINV